MNTWSLSSPFMCLLFDNINLIINLQHHVSDVGKMTYWSLTVTWWLSNRLTVARIVRCRLHGDHLSGYNCASQMNRPSIEHHDRNELGYVV